ncbi:MAG: hypothetical protein IJC27_04915 [Lentisphaeria bacterium]|nr:hypothetical protein [Lentisphaeria bacterium]
MKFISLLAAIVSIFSAAAEVFTIPHNHCTPILDGKADEEVWKNLPYHGDSFTRIGTKEKVAAQTRFKTFHNGKYWFFFIECMEDKIEKLRTASSGRAYAMNRWQDDSVELTFSADSALLNLVKYFINAKGDVTAVNLRDKNISKPAYNATLAIPSAKTAAVIGKERWSLEVAVPIAAIPDAGVKNAVWRFSIGRNRYAGGKTELSGLVPLSRPQHLTPHEFPTAQLKNFEAEKFNIQFTAGEPDNFQPSGKGYSFKQKISAVNRTGFFALIKVKSKLLLNNKTVSETEKIIELPRNAFGSAVIEVPFPQNGNYAMEHTVSNLAGVPIAFARQEIKAAYIPIETTVLAPSYRDCIFATQPEKTVRISVKSKDSECRQLSVKVTGAKEFSAETLTLKNGIAEYTRNFADLPDGSYCITFSDDAGRSAAVRIRKLPYMRGEVWIKPNGTMMIDGKPFIPTGWFHLMQPTDKKYFNTNMDYIRFYPPKANLPYLDRFWAKGMKSLLMPYSEKSGWHLKLFAFSERRGTVSKVQREHIEALAKAVRHHEGLLAYYLADEPENNDMNPEWFAEVRRILMEHDPYHPCVMLNQDYNAIKRFIDSADITFPDCYPNYAADGTSRKPMWRTAEYAKNASSLRPAWLAPQAFCWTQQGKKSRPPTLDEMRNQSWQALINGCKGIIFYSHYDHSQMYYPLIIGPDFIAQEIQDVAHLIAGDFRNDEMKFTVTPADPHFQCALFEADGKMMLAAVNTANEVRKVDFTIPKWQNQTLFMLSENGSCQVGNGKFSVTFQPLETKIFLTSPPAEKHKTVAEVKKQIAELEAARIKKGNLFALGGNLRHDIEEITLGKQAGKLQFALSSDPAIKDFAHRKYGIGYYLFDGMTDEYASSRLHWVPDAADKTPTVTVTLPKKEKISCIRLNTVMREEKSNVKAGTVYAMVEGKMVKCADFKNDSAAWVEINFPAITSEKWQIQITDFVRKKPLLCEIEAYENSGSVKND